MIVLFEGIDGGGKTTTAKILENALKSKYKIKYIREPGGSLLGELARFFTEKGKFSQETKMLLYLLARSDNIDNIVESAKTHIVLLDRFSPSSIAYQGLALGNYEIIYEFEKIIRKGVIPSYTFNLLCSDVSTYIHRQEKRDNYKYTNQTRLGLIDYYNNLANAYELAYSFLKYNNIYNIYTDTPNHTSLKSAKQIYEVIKKDIDKYKIR